MMRLYRYLGSFVVVVLLQAGCRSAGSTHQLVITTAMELVDALEGAGAQVAEVSEEGMSNFGVPVHALEVNGALVHVYEYANLDERVAVSEAISLDGQAIHGTPIAWPDRPNVWTIDRLIVVYPGTDGGIILLFSGLLGDPLTLTTPPLDEPYPPAVPSAIGFLASELNVDPGVVEVISFEPFDWPDTCLDLPNPGEGCVDEEIPGWRITLQVDGRSYLMRTDQLGQDIRYLK